MSTFIKVPELNNVTVLNAEVTQSMLTNKATELQCGASVGRALMWKINYRAAYMDQRPP